MTDTAWQSVLDAHDTSAVRPEVSLHGDALAGDRVSVTLVVDEAATAPVEFGDNLYGATAWAPDGDTWLRVDTAQLRLMIAPIVQPGQRVPIELPLDRAHRRVRVLLGGRWTELRA